MSNKVLITNSQKAVKVPSGLRILIRRACNAVLEYEHFDRPAEISVTFVDNAAIAELNNQYRNKPMPTDVLSFPLGENGVYDVDENNGCKMLGDIVISMERAQEQATLYGHPLQREVAFLTVHSMLHLLGYDHLDEGPMKAQMREREEAILAALGITLEIVPYTDYLTPNVAVEEGEDDANFFQHITYMETYNAENNTHLVNAGSIHYEPMGIYGGSKSSLDELAEGDIIAVPNDGTNEARALLLLQDQGLITLKEGIDASTETATILDIAENPQNLEIVEMEAKNIPHSLPDVAFAVINGNYALQAGLTGNDALASESADSDAAQTYANILAVRAGEEDSAKTQALITALTSETCRQFIEETYSGAVVPIF